MSPGAGRMPGMIGRWHGLVIDCPDPQALATFYQELLGMIRLDDSPGWVTIGDAPDRPGVAFQRVDGYQPPRWPDQNWPQHMHFDVAVPDLAEGEKQVLALGAQVLPGGGERFRVYADPAGHPFCLVL
jgi:catechol 2,3-dioxygenase-like lactoylglutathione lyase family enzyme